LVEKSTEAFMFIPRLFTPNWKVEVTRSDGTVDDITDDLIYLEFDKPVTEGVGQFKVIIDNNRDTYTELYDGGETIRIYLDMDDATTERFEGILGHIRRVDGDFGITLELTGEHVAVELIDVTVAGSYEDEAIEDILEDLVNKYASGFTYDKSIYSCSTTATINWEDGTSFWSAVFDLCVLASYDCYVDDNKVFHFFAQNSYTCELEAVVYGPTLLETDGLGEDIADVKNKVIVYGEDETGLPIIYTASDATSQDSYNLKEKVIKDSSINSMDEAEERADAELAELKDPIVRGVARCQGMPTVNPGDLIWVVIPPLGLYNKYRVLKITHIIDQGDYITELELSKPTRGFSYQFKEQTKADLVTRTVLNPNKLEYSYNFTFDGDIEDNPNIEDPGDLKTAGGKLVIATGTSGTAITSTKVATNNITQVELKVVGANLDDSTFHINTVEGAGDDTWEAITRNVLHNVINTGNRNLALKIYLEEFGTTEPEIDSISLLFK